MPKFQVELVDPKGRSKIVTADSEETILEAAEEAGIDLPYSCRGAACATCAGQVLEGEVALDEQFILSAADLSKGFTLTCSARPRSNCKILTHQQDTVETV